MRLQLGEALATGGFIVLVVTPLVYRAHTASQHVVAKGSTFWPTAWMILPLVIFVVGVALMVSGSNRFTPRRKRRVRTASRPPT